MAARDMAADAEAMLRMSMACMRTRPELWCDRAAALRSDALLSGTVLGIIPRINLIDAQGDEPVGADNFSKAAGQWGSSNM
jgi:hypothetical protein